MSTNEHTTELRTLLLEDEVQDLKELPYIVTVYLINRIVRTDKFLFVRWSLPVRLFNIS